jgi:hypothetical protein
MLDAFLPGVRALTKLDLQYNWGLAADVDELQQQYNDVSIVLKASFWNPRNIAASYYSDVESEGEKAV